MGKRFTVPELSGSRLLKLADRMTFAAFCACVFAVYILDMIFFGSLVELGPLTIVYVIIGAVLRTIAVAAGVFLQKFKPGDRLHEHRATIRALWIFCVVACLLSAINFFAAGHADKAAGASTAETIAATTSDTKAARIDAIETEIEDIRKDRDDAVASVARAMQAIEDDGVPGISAADNQRLAELREEEERYREKAREDIKAARDRQEAIRNERDAAIVDGAVAAKDAGTWQVFVWLSDHTPISVDTWSNGGLFFFAMLVELIAAFGLGAYVALKPVYARILAHIEIEEATSRSHHEAELASARLRSESEVAMLKVEQETQRIRHEAELTAARIRAEALRQQLQRQAEEEAAAIAGGTPEEVPAADPPVTDPPDPPAAAEDLDPSKVGPSAGGAAKDLYSQADKRDDRIPAGDWRVKEGAGA